MSRLPTPAGEQTVRLDHAALLKSSAAESDRLFVQVLGLKRLRTKVVPAEVAGRVFDWAREFEVREYGGEGLKFEVFLGPAPSPRLQGVGHVCLEVENREEVLARARAAGLETKQVPRGESVVVFLADGEGNLFELKERPVSGAG